jgi:hypothetical protein
MKNRHILTYSQFLNEQAVDPLAAMGGMPGVPGAVPAPKEKPSHFIFLDKSDMESYKTKKYPDGSSEVSFPTYSLTSVELDDWTKKNIFTDDTLTAPVVDLRRKNIIDIVKGDKVNISDEDIPFLNKLKNSLSTDMFGRREPEVTILFTKDGIPTTEDIGVTFINYRKK